MGTLDRRELISNVCSQLWFLISNMGNSNVITSIEATPIKEYGAYSCGSH